MAAKNNTSESQIDKTSFYFHAFCAVCHPGGGSGEFDRDGMPYHDPASGQFGYEMLGKSAAEVALDGDYSVLNPSDGSMKAAPWDVTGVHEPDCLYCHRSERVISQDGKNMNWIWRAGTLRGRESLVDDQGNPVPAFAAAPVAAQGWFSSIQMVSGAKPPQASALTIDYNVGVQDGSLLMDNNGALSLNHDSMTLEPRDLACWGCHVTADLKKRGQVWFQPAEDVHFAHYNKRNDADPSNDISDADSRVCMTCHDGDPEHNFTKGHAFLSTVSDSLDYQGLKTCAECHDPNDPNHDPDATEPTSPIHTIGAHTTIMSCESCHIPWITNSAQVAVDNATTGKTIGYFTPDFYSDDPQNPSATGDSRWYPSMRWKQSKDGLMRLYPNKLLLSVWWGDWDQNGTPNDLSDDIVSPIILWRVRQITGSSPLAGVVDDNGDGKPEVNTHAEILTYIQAMKGNDSYGNPLAANPVLVKGGQVYYEDAGSMTGVSSIHYEGTGMHVESSHPFSINHNVRPASDALGANYGCASCHRGLNTGFLTDTFDRLILVDPFDETGAPVFETVHELTGVLPF